jgi:hypothetical protein
MHHRHARAVGTGGLAQRSHRPPPRTLRALPALGVEARPPRRGEPACADRAPSRVEWGSLAWKDTLAGVAGLPGLGRFLCSFTSRAFGTQCLRSDASPLYGLRFRIESDHRNSYTGSGGNPFRIA